MSSGPRAAFVPFPTHLDLKDFVSSRENIVFATRINCKSIDQYPLEDFENLVYTHVIRTGKPLVIEGFEERLNQNLFSPDWLKRYMGKKIENCWDQVGQKNVPYTIQHYLNNMPKLAENVSSRRDLRTEPQRLYLKDIDCPKEWQASLENIIPPFLFYLNDRPRAFTGPGSKYTEMPPYPRTKDGAAIAKAGDLMSSLPPEMRAENLMCYIGHEGTYTAAHREMCGSLSQNLMVEASNGEIENDKKTRPGSSVWFMTETFERQIVAEYWKSMLGHDLDLEKHFASIAAWKKAPFTTYVVEQVPGDLVLIPPLCVQQVWNRGTRTMKVAWNRTTVETLQWALDEELSRARAICREEQYKNKAIIFYSLEKYSKLLEEDPGKSHPGVDALWEDFEYLFKMFTDVLLSECFSTGLPAEKKTEYLEFTGDVTCSYCRCNIFNRFLTCEACVDGAETYDVCMDCYVFGRSCRCISKLKWVEQFRWKGLEGRHEKWRSQIMKHFEKDGYGVDHPVFSAVRAEETQKSVAELCQEQLRVRPWVDCKKPVQTAILSDSESEQVHDRRSSKRRKANHKSPKKTDKAKKKRKPEEMGRCHICKPRPIWTLKHCSTCDSQYCYGCLFRLFDLPPQQAMQFSDWECPKCQKVCSCSSCNKKPDKMLEPYQPQRLLLGHDTSKVADERSVESLVDLRQSNAGWMKKFQRTKNQFYAERFERLKREADEARLALDETRANPVPELVPPQGLTFDSSLAAMDDDDSIIREDNQPENFPVDPYLDFNKTFIMLDHPVTDSALDSAIDPALGIV
ncbi:uncharacterized protein N7469_006010 [Penicillium citrinum]|uniref:JmjC domain-containing protein n=1 Tax=Penicillium citrinum TaxID=5077 RepID=A0A9W9NX93_PENCI|nr:uncharacterized protein N7469_006010 [Penicillium citrinum]KAJ5231422.1 hypothetical protein N7469_006010 [Penicillium citrinum]